MNSDDHRSASQPPIVFQYGTAILAVMMLGFPILFAMAIIFPCVSVYLLMRPLSLGMKLDAIIMGGMGLAFGWIGFIGLRTWYSFFTVYEVDRQGIKARLRSVATFYPWEHLKSARYRKAFGQIDIDSMEYRERWYSIMLI